MSYRARRDTANRNAVRADGDKLPAPLVVNLFKRIRRRGDLITVSGLCVTKQLNSPEPVMDTDRIELSYGVGKSCRMNFKSRFGLRFVGGWRLNRYSFTLDINELTGLDVQNKLIVVYDERNEGRIIYSAVDFKTGTHRNSEVFFRDGLSIYFRQTVFNTMYLTVRETNRYDFPEGRAMIAAAQRRARFMSKDVILMYEKECSRYEESASVLFEKLIDCDYTNAYYILNAGNPALEKMPEKYRRNIIIKDSFEHALCFFRSNTVISTETIDHAMQLRAADRRIQKKYRSPGLRYVFLQHGVMYMVSLDADLRSGFKQTGIELYRVVASSEAEARHFTELGGFDREEIYVTGLAKFDRSCRTETANRITIMPTWRRWEANIAREDFTATKYFKMIDRMVSAVPEELKDRVVVLPHPLMQSAMQEADSELRLYLKQGMTHDEVLRETDLLITDYSSIAYDAFYRGSNVIFCWDEKDECMEHYGGAHLMLNEDNVFGDVCCTAEELGEAIRRNYMSGQSERNCRRFGEIVSFHDGRNTERIIECLKRDNLIHS